jgi:3-dehydroshikimate dehydratase
MNMIKTGLVSVTFRKLAPEDIVQLVSEAGLDGIEWGGDIHVPHGNIKQARTVGAMTRDIGLKVAAYGSYYRVGCAEKPKAEFEQILETALALGAPVVRVWAGNKGSDEADEAYWGKIVEESQKIAGMAEEVGIKLAYEYHGRTLTDTDESARRLLREVDRTNMMSYWQPSSTRSFEQCLNDLENILPYLLNVHAFYWKGGKRLPFEDGFGKWEKYIDLVRSAPGEHYVMLEFVKDDEPGQFKKDVLVLKKLVNC